MIITPKDQGWYPDPDGQPLLRWWNGSAWTHATLPGPAGAEGATKRARPSRRRHSQVLTGLIVFGVVVAVLDNRVDHLLQERNASRAAAAAAAPAPAPAAPTPEPTIDTALEATVVIRQSTEYGTTVGTAVAIGPDTLLTAAHVVDEAETALISRANGSTMAAEVVEISEESDLALVRTVAAHSLPVATVAAADPEVYSEVRALGSPNGRVQESMGRVTALCDCDGDGAEEIETDAAIRSGNSGGPLVNGAGEIVGIVSFRLGDPNYGYAVSTDQIHAFLAGLDGQWQGPAPSA